MIKTFFRKAIFLIFCYKLKGILRYECVNRENLADDGSVTYTKFCATTKDYDRDKKWVKNLSSHES